MRRAHEQASAGPPIELVIDELVIDGEVFGPSGHAPSLVLALQDELARLLAVPGRLQALREGGGLQVDTLSAGRVVAAGAGPGLAAALLRALDGALAGAGGTSSTSGSSGSAGSSGSWQPGESPSGSSFGLAGPSPAGSKEPT